MNANTRLKLGVALLVIGLIMPFGAFLVAGTDWPTAVKTVVSGILVLGFEILMFPAIALMGKENFDRIVTRVKGLKSKRQRKHAVESRVRSQRQTAVVV